MVHGQVHEFYADGFDFIDEVLRVTHEQNEGVGFDDPFEAMHPKISLIIRRCKQLVITLACREHEAEGPPFANLHLLLGRQVVLVDVEYLRVLKQGILAFGIIGLVDPHLLRVVVEHEVPLERLVVPFEQSGVLHRLLQKALHCESLVAQDRREVRVGHAEVCRLNLVLLGLALGEVHN